MKKFAPSDPIFVDWRMKDVSTARFSERVMEDERSELVIQHEVALGVTPPMLVWWLQHLHGIIEHRGRVIPMYRLWHPTDHISARVLKPAPDGSPGFSKGAYVEISERILVPVRLQARVIAMDERGVHLTLLKKGGEIADLFHTFTETREGTLIRSHLIIGSTVPLIGGLLTRLMNKRILSSDLWQAWIKHNVEEVGNLQYFLPGLYKMQTVAA